MSDDKHRHDKTKIDRRMRYSRRNEFKMNPQLWVAFVQFVIVGTCLVIAIETSRFVDWLITLSWVMTATLWLVQGLKEMELRGHGSYSKGLSTSKGTRRR